MSFSETRLNSTIPDSMIHIDGYDIIRKDRSSLPGNYRPISVLPAISNVMERILYNQLYEYLTENNVLSEHQFGFRKFHSTASALLDCTNDWYINMDRKLFNLVVFIDLILLTMKFYCKN